LSVSEAQKKATTKYQRNNYDRVLLRLPKGKREELQKQAERESKSVNEYLLNLIEKDR
jgi:predicted HicB family RNase H-like nuclease